MNIIMRGMRTQTLNMVCFDITINQSFKLIIMRGA